MMLKEEILRIIEEELKEWWERVEHYKIPRQRLGTYQTIMAIIKKIKDYDNN